MAIESILIFLVIGLIAGWLAGKIVEGTGFGLVGDLVVGVIGAFIGGWLLSYVGVFAVGIVGALVSAVIGAVVLLVIIKLIRGGGRWSA
jgi:uncharacterized membrane protein YeaQ/YmgE (transglycosylase-associated protein family)